MTRCYVVVSGIPGSGKSTFGRLLSQALALPMLDKDDFLERSFATEGPIDSARRRLLSRESDVAFCQAAAELTRAILVSFWHVPGMSQDSGTPTTWLPRSEHIACVNCVCAPAVAARRFLARQRHQAHGDQARTLESLVSEFESLAQLGAPAFPNRVFIDTTEPPNRLMSSTPFDTSMAICQVPNKPLLQSHNCTSLGASMTSIEEDV